METYELPPDPEGMTPTDAAAALTRLTGEALSDRRHPLADGGHALHRQYAEHQHRLAGIVEESRGAEQAASDAKARAAFGATADEPGEKTRQDLRDFLNGPDAHQNAVRAEAEKEMARLEALGFEPSEIPDGIEPYQVSALRMQRLNAEGNTAELVPMMERELISLRAPQSTMALFRSYVNARDQDPELRTSILEPLISWIHQANVRRYGKAKPSAPDTEGGDDDGEAY